MGSHPCHLSNGNKNHASCHLNETDEAPNAVHGFSADVDWALPSSWGDIYLAQGQ